MEHQCLSILPLQALHECITALMINAKADELDGFRFNESLLLPVQHVLCLDLCPLETQVFCFQIDVPSNLSIFRICSCR